MTIAHLLVPDLKRLAADAVEDAQEAGLERVLEHLVLRPPRARPAPLQPRWRKVRVSTKALRIVQRIVTSSKCAVSARAFNHP